VVYVIVEEVVRSRKSGSSNVHDKRVSILSE